MATSMSSMLTRNISEPVNSDARSSGTLPDTTYMPDVETILPDTLSEPHCNAHQQREAESYRNTSHSASLAPEVLAACFAFLSVGECIKASHVSRAWRDAALAFPRLWSHIELSTRPSHASQGPESSILESRTVLHCAEILILAISRSGQCPLDISIGAEAAHTLNAAVGVLEDNLHRVRSLAWPYPLPDGLCRRPAPLLEHLDCDFIHHIPVDICGGNPGCLRRLRVRNLQLPRDCPALSTVTHLTASLRWPAHQPRSQREGLRRLFELMPVLESLALSELSCAEGHLPSGPAPRTLTHLALEDTFSAFDLVHYVRIWRTEGLHTVAITSRRTNFFQFLPGVLFEGAKSISFAVAHKALEIRTTPEPGADGLTSTCTLIGAELLSKIFSFARKILIKFVEPTRLQDISGPDALLDAVLDFDDREWPALRCVRIGMNKRRGRELECDHLGFLRRFRPSQLSHVVVDVSTDTLSALEKVDAMRLVAALEATPISVAIRGFPPACVQDVNVGQIGIAFMNT